jgi:hypothetical protein
MNRLGMLTFVCSLAFSTLPSNTARADAESIAARCVTEVQNTVSRVEFIVAQRTTDTVRLIKRYLSVGRVEEAIAAARQCVDQTKDDMRAAAQYITRVCDHCINKLLRMEEYQLARRVAYACDSAIGKFSGLLDRQELVLADALNEN